MRGSKTHTLSAGRCGAAVESLERRQMLAGHPHPGALATAALDGDTLVITGSGKSDVITVALNASDATKSPDSKAAADALAAKKIPAEAFTLNAYAAVEVLKAGIEKAGSAEDAEAVATALKGGEQIPTAIGKLTYGETGDLSSQSFSLYKWEGGKIVAAE